MVNAYVFDFLKVWDEAVYEGYSPGSDAIRAAVFAAFTTLKTLTTRFPGVTSASTLTTADGLTFKVRLSTTNAAYIRVLGTP